MQWGMIIPNSNDLVINGRLEELFVKPFFKGLLERKRCVITFQGYYEWNEQNKKAYLFIPKGAKNCITPKCSPTKATIDPEVRKEDVFQVACLWNNAFAGKENPNFFEHNNFVILTMGANDVVS
jgi:putative SOS response-associated peptidase YedK